MRQKKRARSPRLASFKSLESSHTGTPRLRCSFSTSQRPPVVPFIRKDAVLVVLRPAGHRFSPPSTHVPDAAASSRRAACTARSICAEKLDSSVRCRRRRLRGAENRIRPGRAHGRPRSVARRCGTRPLSPGNQCGDPSWNSTPSNRCRFAGTTYHEDDAGRRVTFDSRAGGATGRTASTSAAWPSECCCRCSSSSSGHER